ncbi:MAG: CapA family protein [Proteobacteria bacterium]|jgi:poly-gamma-glutamate capsule biosynthesis protein CapA/YwtB (metallophosphatase superfamily)|nr:CapA family protein [Pseudomonadota bacterium]MCG6936138.1 CapA family protein [Pseudomonadota bacterium]
MLLGLLAGCSNLPETASPESEITPEAAPPVYLEVVAVGDIMPGTDFPENQLPPQDGATLLAAMTPVLSAADITFGNLEGTLMDDGEPEKKCKDPAHCYLFRSPARYAVLLQQAGFNVISLANNHARDFGETGRDASMRALESVAIRHSGRDGDIASWVVKGQRVALIAFAPFKNSHDMLDIPAARKLVAGLAASHDVVLVSIHAGAEGPDALHVPFESEFYYGEDRGDVVAFSHAVIDAGADLVIGHGPHVPRALELYRGRLVAYSLGNFCTYYGISVAGMKGWAPVLKVRLNQDGAFIDGQIVSARQIRPAGPAPDPDHAAARLMKTLTEQDFPESELSISNEGKITRKSTAQAVQAVPVMSTSTSH